MCNVSFGEDQLNQEWVDAEQNNRKMSNLLNAVERFVFLYESWHYAANGCIQIKMTYLIKLADITQC